MSAWPNKRLEEVACIERDMLQPEDITSGQKYLGLEHVAEGGEILGAVEVQNGDLKSTKFGFTEKHVLYGKLRPYLAKIAMPHFAGICSTEIVPIRPGAELDRNFLAYFLRQPSQVALATVRSSGANLPRLSPNELAKFEIPVPPLPEQRRIAAILDQADALRAKRREALAKLDEMAQAIFEEMTNGSDVYPLSRLDEVCSLITDGTHQTPTYCDDGTIFLSAKNVTSGRINWTNVKKIPQSLHRELHKRLTPKRGDILLAKNGTTGMSAIVDKDVVFDIYVSLALLRPKASIDVKYLWLALNSRKCKEAFKSALKGVGVQNLHLIDIRRATIPVPPPIIQKDIVEKIEGLERLEKNSVKSLTEFESLFSSLQHRAFSGDL